MTIGKILHALPELCSFQQLLLPELVLLALPLPELFLLSYSFLGCPFLSCSF